MNFTSPLSASLFANHSFVATSGVSFVFIELVKGKIVDCFFGLISMRFNPHRGKGFGTCCASCCSVTETALYALEPFRIGQAFDSERTV